MLDVILRRGHVRSMCAQVSKVDPHTPQEEAKASLIDKLDTYVQVTPSFPDTTVLFNNFLCS